MSSPWIPWSSPTNVAFPNRRWSEKTCGFVKRFCPTSDASLQAALISGWVALFSHAAMRIRGQPRGRKLAKAPCGVTSSNRPSQFVGRFGLDVATAPKASQSLEVSSATTFFDRRLPLGEKENQKKTTKQKIVAKEVGILISDKLLVWHGKVSYPAYRTAETCSVSGMPWWCRNKHLPRKSWHNIFWGKVLSNSLS